MLNKPFNPTLVAHAVNHVIHSNGVDITKCIRSLESRGFKIRMSHAGVDVQHFGQVVYTDGTFVPAAAKGREQCSMYRLRQIKLLKWALVNAPSPELKAVEGWINAQLS